MKWLQRIRNLYFWSGISPQDVKENPHSYTVQAVNKQEMKGQAYIIGMSDEEQSFKESLGTNDKIVA